MLIHAHSRENKSENDADRRGMGSVCVALCCRNFLGIGLVFFEGPAYSERGGQGEPGKVCWKGRWACKFQVRDLQCSPYLGSVSGLCAGR